MKSLGQKIKQISGLAGTGDVSEWEEEFIDSIVTRTNNGESTGFLTEKQTAVVERIWSQHYV